jgi:hypothetical protein
MKIGNPKESTKDSFVFFTENKNMPSDHHLIDKSCGYFQGQWIYLFSLFLEQSSETGHCGETWRYY